MKKLLQKLVESGNKLMSKGLGFIFCLDWALALLLTVVKMILKRIIRSENTDESEIAYETLENRISRVMIRIKKKNDGSRMVLNIRAYEELDIKIKL